MFNWTTILLSVTLVFGIVILIQILLLRQEHQRRAATEYELELLQRAKQVDEQEIRRLRQRLGQYEEQLVSL
jgi:hypothetical protein